MLPLRFGWSKGKRPRRYAEGVTASAVSAATSSRSARTGCDAAIALLTGEASLPQPTPADVTLIVDADQPAVAELVDTDESSSGTCAQACRHDGADDSVTTQLFGRAVAPSVGERLLCDRRVQALVESADRGPLAVGRSARFINRRLRRALERRDNGICRFPGCHATRRLHAHHIIHWLHGGPTELDNLILVCHFHHHLLHEGGWNVDRLTHPFIRPDGTEVESSPPHLRAGVGAISPDPWPSGNLGPLAPPSVDRLDLVWTVTELRFNERVSRRDAGVDDPWGEVPVWAM